MTSSLAVFESAGKISASDKITFVNQKKRENVEIKIIFYIKLHLKDRFGMQFTTYSGELMPEEALISFTVSDAYR